MVDAIKITLETLYDILRNEKKKEDLQKLDPAFFIDVVGYLREKQSLLETKKNEDTIFSVGEKDKLEYELRSIRRILKELYEKREKKILDIALNRSRTGSDIIDTSAMLREEKEFYQESLSIFDRYRQGVMFNLFKGELPFLLYSIKKPSEPSSMENITEKETSPKSSPRVQVPLEKKFMSRVRFIHPMPSFVWKDMKVYGPFDVGEEFEIYPEVAELLVRKKRAVMV